MADRSFLTSTLKELCRAWLRTKSDAERAVVVFSSRWMFHRIRKLCLETCDKLELNYDRLTEELRGRLEIKVLKGHPNFDGIYAGAKQYWMKVLKCCLADAKQHLLKEELSLIDDPGLEPLDSNLGGAELVDFYDHLLRNQDATARKVFQLHVLEERSLAEIASDLQLEMGTVRKAWGRCRKQALADAEREAPDDHEDLPRG